MSGTYEWQSRKGACNPCSIEIQITYVFPFWKCAMPVMRSVTQGIRCLQRTAENLSGRFQNHNIRLDGSPQWGTLYLLHTHSPWRYLLQPEPPFRKRRRLQTVRGPGIFKSTTFLWQIAFTVTRSLGHFTAARSKALHWVSVKFLASLPQNTWVFMSSLWCSIGFHILKFAS